MPVLSPYTTHSGLVIADDHSVVADGLSSVFKKTCDVIGVSREARHIAGRRSKLKSDIIVPDIGMLF